MTFTETIPRLTQHVPGPKYDLTRHWDKVDPIKKQTLLKAPVNSFISQIIKNNKKPEKSSPSPALY